MITAQASDRADENHVVRFIKEKLGSIHSVGTLCCSDASVYLYLTHTTLLSVCTWFRAFVYGSRFSVTILYRVLNFPAMLYFQLFFVFFYCCKTLFLSFFRLLCDEICQNKCLVLFPPFFFNSCMAKSTELCTVPCNTIAFLQCSTVDRSVLWWSHTAVRFPFPALVRGSNDDWLDLNAPLFVLFFCFVSFFQSIRCLCTRSFSALLVNKGLLPSWTWLCISLVLFF